MKLIIAFGLGLISLNLIGQEFNQFKECTSTIRTINPRDTNFADLEFLVPILESKRVVLLGEQEHGDGAAFLAKTRLIKFLNKRLGFKVVAFETPFYSTITTWDKFLSGQASIDEVAKSLVYKQWSSSLEMEPLFELAKNKEIQLAGFDLSYIKKNEYEQYIRCIDSLIQKTNGDENLKFKSILTDLLTKGISFIPEESDQKLFVDKLNVAIDRIDSLNDGSSLFWKQELRNLIALGTGRWLNDAHTRQNWWSSGNFRDKQMAENIFWLLNSKYPDEKIIVWSANYHIANNVSTEVVKEKYFNNVNAISMGEHLKTRMSADIYSLGILSYSGVRTIIEDNFENHEMKPRSKSSFETFLSSSGYEYSFSNFNSCVGTQKFKMAGFFHYELLGNWTKVFDGVFFINRMTPITFKSDR